MSERWQRRYTTMLWWSLAAGLAATLKWHFSVAAASELKWMLEPLAMLLRLITGWRFTANEAGEWYSLDAGIVLVKACAGINFMILSWLGWCWICRPANQPIRSRQALLEWPLLLVSALVLSWAVSLIVNASRVLAVVHWQPYLEQWLPAGQAHRLLGLLIYLAAFNLQLLLGDRRRWRRTLLIGSGLYLSLVLGVPVMTGNAMTNPGLYAEHALAILCVIAPFLLVLAATWRRH